MCVKQAIARRGGRGTAKPWNWDLRKNQLIIVSQIAGANSPEQLILDCLEKADWKNPEKDFGRNYKRTKETKCAEKKFYANIFKANGKSLRENIQAKRCICFQERCNAKDLEDSGVDAFYSTSFATRLLMAFCFILSRV